MCGSLVGLEKWPAAVVFDLDGTLVDSAGDIAGALNELLGTKHLASFSLPEVSGFIGGGLSALLEKAFAARGCSLDTEELSESLSLFRAIYGGRLTRMTKTYVGVVDLLSRLTSDRVALAVCTNKEERLAQAIIDGVGLRARFAAVIGGMPCRPKKPSPLPLLETLARLEVAPADAIMVGDSAVDVECAREAGVAFVGVTFGYSHLPITRLGAKIAIDHFHEFEGACAELRNMRR